MVQKEKDLKELTTELLSELVKLDESEVKKYITMIKNRCGDKKYTDSLYDAVMKMKGK